MVAQNQISLTRHLPVITLAMIGAAAVVYALPDLQPALVYDRKAILNGELWRVVTGHWVHFSLSHLVYDALALGMAGWIIENRGYPNFGWLCALSPIVIGSTLLALEPQLNICGGLSGIATGAVVFLALHGLKETGAWRWICLVALMLTIGKLGFEMMASRFLLVKLADGSFAPVTASHITGGLLALVIYTVSKIQNPVRLSQPKSWPTTLTPPTPTCRRAC